MFDDYNSGDGGTIRPPFLAKGSGPDRHPHPPDVSAVGAVSTQAISAPGITRGALMGDAAFSRPNFGRKCPQHKVRLAPGEKSLCVQRRIIRGFAKPSHGRNYRVFPTAKCNKRKTTGGPNHPSFRRTGDFNDARQGKHHAASPTTRFRTSSMLFGGATGATGGEA
jgi:hypothetical protein